jgi:hypothetical protein
MPALNNIHLHIGYEGFVSWSVENHTPENVLDHLKAVGRRSCESRSGLPPNVSPKSQDRRDPEAELGRRRLALRFQLRQLELDDGYGFLDRFELVARANPA